MSTDKGVPQDDDGAEVAFTILSDYFPGAEDRERVPRKMMDVLAKEFRRAGMKPPPWLDERAE